MKLAYFQNLNECDPLPKLGRKVEPIKDLTPEQKRKAHVHAFERMGATQTPAPVDIDLSKPESWPTLPVASFADAAEMAEARKSEPTFIDYITAWDRAVKRVGLIRTAAARNDAVEPLLKGRRREMITQPSLWPAAIAALEALQ